MPTGLFLIAGVFMAGSGVLVFILICSAKPVDPPRLRRPQGDSVRPGVYLGLDRDGEGASHG